jgi:glycosyltransferase involved in cell wall biosynthesis
MTGVVMVSFHLDRRGRDPDALLAAWPTLADAPVAAAAAGVDVAVVQPAATDAVQHRGGVAFHFVRERPGFRRGSPGTRPVRPDAPALTRRVRELRPLVLHVQGLSLPGHARRLVDALPGVRVLAQDHADGIPRWWRRRHARRDARCYDAVAFTAPAQADPFVRAGLFRPGLPVHRVIEASTRFTPGDPAAARESAGIHGDPCLAWIGRLDANKDPLTILEALARAAPRLPDPHLWMAWREAPLLDAVRRRIDRDPVLRDRVHLLGRLEPARVETLLRAADWLIQGSAREGSGFAVIEALACGTTPIVTDIPAFRALAGDTALLWPTGDVAALTSLLASLAGRDRDALRAAALDRFRQELSWAAVGRQLAGAWAATLAGTSPVAAPAHTPATLAPGTTP